MGGYPEIRCRGVLCNLLQCCHCLCVSTSVSQSLSLSQCALRSSEGRRSFEWPLCRAHYGARSPFNDLLQQGVCMLVCECGRVRVWVYMSVCDCVCASRPSQLSAWTRC